MSEGVQDRVKASVLPLTAPIETRNHRICPTKDSGTHSQVHNMVVHMNVAAVSVSDL